MENTSTKASGRCLCGAVQYEVHGALGDAHVCHCNQCRRQSGHCVAATSAKRADFVLTEQRGLKWYVSSPVARRGFCGDCGSALFWDDQGDEVSINAGSLDQPTGIKVTSHIFIDDKADYYEIADDLPKYTGYDTPVASD